MEIKKIKAAKGLTLALAITSVVAFIPMLGYIVNVMTFGVVNLATLALAIVTLVFCARAKVTKIGAILAIIANGLAFISGLLMSLDFYSKIMSAANYGAFDSIAEMMYDGDLPLFMLGFILGLIVWILYLVSAIILFVNFSKIRKTQKEIELGSYNPVNYRDDAQDVLSNFTYQTEKDDSVLQNGNNLEQNVEDEENKL